MNDRSRDANPPGGHYTAHDSGQREEAESHDAPPPSRLGLFCTGTASADTSSSAVLGTMNFVTMKNSKHRLHLAIVTAAMIIAACGGTPTAESPTVATATTAVTPIDTNSATTATATPPTAAEAIEAAVDALLDAGSYAFEAEILVSSRGDDTEVTIEGWVDGADRQLVTTLDEQSVTTLVIAGIATVDTDGEVVEVPLEEAGNAPSILVLSAIQNPVFEDESTISGKLNSSALASADYEVSGSAEIRVTFGQDGHLSGYSIAAKNNSWSIEVAFTKIGEPHPVD